MYPVWRQPRPSSVADVELRHHVPEPKLDISERAPAALDFAVKIDGVGEYVTVLQWGEVHSMADALIDWLYRTSPRRMERMSHPEDQLPPLSPGE